MFVHDIQELWHCFLTQKLHKILWYYQESPKKFQVDATISFTNMLTDLQHNLKLNGN